jgi:hypothetical protein
LRCDTPKTTYPLAFNWGEEVIQFFRSVANLKKIYGDLWFNYMRQFPRESEDTDDDGVPDDGDGNGVAGDNPCPDGQTANCDDNCPFVPNNDQLDVNANGIGDACE